MTRRLVCIELDPSRRNPDDRPLGWSGSFLTGQFRDSDVAQFVTADSALNIANRAPNRRKGATVETRGQRRSARA